MRADDVPAVLDALAGSGGACCLARPDGGIEHGPVGERTELLAPRAVADEVRRIRPGGLRAAARTGTPGGTLLVHPLGLRQRPSNYLAVAFPGRPTASQQASVATAVALLSISAEQRLDRREADRRVRARAVQTLVGDDPATATVLLSARAVGGRARLPGRLVVLRAGGPEDAVADALAEVEEEHPLSGRLGDELVVVVRPGAGAAVAAALAGHGLRVGLGEPAVSSAASGSFRTAGHALAVATAANPLVSWADTVHHGVLAVLDPDRATAFARTFLQPLHDRPELLDTLRSFLRHHGSRLRVAQELAVHRNTVRHRVAQIEAALGESLQDPRVRVNAWVALQATADQGPRT
jgi:purine catabolism regulator